ncbi:MAG: alpha/beta hydrolase [Sandaracinaceae bacterium]
MSALISSFSSSTNKSTTGRSRRDPRVPPSWMRGGIGALETASPEAAGRALAHLFFRTTRLPEREANAKVMGLASRGSLRFEGESVAVWSWGRGPAVLLAHGWNGRASQLSGFVEPLLRRDRRVVAFDHVGHGESTGNETNLLQMARATRAVADYAGGVDGLVAHSLGAASSLFAHTEGLAVQRAALIASPISPEPWLGYMAKIFGVGEKTVAVTRERIERRVGARMDELYLPDYASDVDARILLVHDRDDHEVAIRTSETLHAALPGSEIVRTEGLGHNRILRTPEVLERVAEFVTAAS